MIVNETQMLFVCIVFIIRFMCIFLFDLMWQFCFADNDLLWTL